MPPENIDDINVDELLAGIESPAPEREMGEPTPEVPAEPEPPAWDPTPWEFDWNGKKVAPDSPDKAKIWMSQGYNYSQRVGELNAKEKAWLKEREELLPYKDKYSSIDDYASKNPEWWNHVRSSYETREQFNQPQVDPALAQLLKPIQDKIGQIDQFMTVAQQREQEQEQRQLEEAAQKEDQTLTEEIESIRKANPNIDLNARDESGETLEWRILKHAKDIGTSSFRAAYRDYLHDNLVQHAKANGREAIAKDTQMKAKKGILGQTPTPLKGIQGAENVRSKSWNDLADEAKRELGII